MKGLKIQWTFAPKEIKILGANGEEKLLLNWRATPTRSQAFTETLLFSNTETLTQIKIVARDPIADYIGIALVSPLPGGLPIFSLVNGITLEAGGTASIGGGGREQCLTVSDGDFRAGAPVALEDCIVGAAAGDGRELWIETPDKRLLSVADQDLCLAARNGLASPDDSQLVVDNCRVAREFGDARDIFNFAPNAQIEISLAPTTCVYPRGERAGFTNLLKQQQQQQQSGGTSSSKQSDQESEAGSEGGSGFALSASSVMDTEHEAANAASASSDSFWASQAFPDASSHNVYYQIDFLSVREMNKIEIEWEYPPLTYSISLSKDGTNFGSVERVDANPLNHTMDDLGHQSARFLRVEMYRPHPTLGRLATSAEAAPSFVYGIIHVSVLAHRLTVGLADCAVAARADDARDKFFRVTTSHFDSALATAAAGAGKEFSGATDATERAVAAVAAAVDKMKPCADESTSVSALLSPRLKKVHEESLHTLAGLDRTLLQNRPIYSLSSLGGNSHSLGLSAENPASSCAQVRDSAIGMNGFYFIQGPCFPEPLRIFCDLDNTVGFFFDNTTVGLINRDGASLDKLALACASRGLEPLTLRGPKNVELLRNVLAANGVDPAVPPAPVRAADTASSGTDTTGGSDTGESSDDDEDNPGFIPLAFDLACEATGLCSSTFVEPNGFSDVTGILAPHLNAESAGTAESRVANSIGFASLEPNGLTVSDWRSANLAGIFCSATSVSSPFIFNALLACDQTVADDRGVFRGSVRNTSFRLTCPDSCFASNTASNVLSNGMSSSNERSLNIYGGDDDLYSDTSALCLAARHAGLNPRDFVATLETPRIEYRSVTRNGLASLADTGRAAGGGVGGTGRGGSSSSPRRFGVRLSPPVEHCPILSSVQQGLSGGGFEGRRLRAPLGMGVSGETEDMEFVEEGEKRGTALLQAAEAQGTNPATNPATLVEVNEASKETGEAAAALVEQMMKMDKHASLLIRQSVAVTLSEGRGVLKPIENTVEKMASLALRLNDETALANTRAARVLESQISTVDDYNLRLASMKTKTLQFTSLRVAPPPSSNEVESVFDIYGSAALSLSFDSSNGVVADGNYESPFGSTFDISSGETFDGQILLLKRAAFYDFTLRTSLVLSQPATTAGVVLRARSSTNFLALLFQPAPLKLSGTSESSAAGSGAAGSGAAGDGVLFKLVRVRDGTITELSSPLEADVVDLGSTINLQITTEKGRITVFLFAPPENELQSEMDDGNGSVSGTPVVKVIDVIDETFASGSVGYAILRNEGRTRFGQLQVESHYCDRSSGLVEAVHHAPTPRKCAFFSDAHDHEPLAQFEAFLTCDTPYTPRGDSREAAPTSLPTQVKRHDIDSTDLVHAMGQSRGQSRGQSQSQLQPSFPKSLFSPSVTIERMHGGRPVSLRVSSKLALPTALAAAVFKSQRLGTCHEGTLHADFLPSNCGGGNHSDGEEIEGSNQQGLYGFVLDHAGHRDYKAVLTDGKEVFLYEFLPGDDAVTDGGELAETVQSSLIAQAKLNKENQRLLAFARWKPLTLDLQPGGAQTGVLVFNGDVKLPLNIRPGTTVGFAFQNCRDIFVDSYQSVPNLDSASAEAEAEAQAGDGPSLEVEGSHLLFTEPESAPESAREPCREISSDEYRKEVCDKLLPKTRRNFVSSSAGSRGHFFIAHPLNARCKRKNNFCETCCNVTGSFVPAPTGGLLHPTQAVDGCLRSCAATAA